MKVFVLLSAILVAVVARPDVVPTTVNIQAAPIAFPTPIIASSVISSQFHAQDGLGQYNYGYSNPLASKAEIKTADGITQGGYSYVDAEGKLQTVQYTSDDVNGFRVAATNLPQTPSVAPIIAPLQPMQDTPEVSLAKAKHYAAVKAFEAHAEAIARARDNIKIAPVPTIFGTNPLLTTLPGFRYTYGIPGYGYNYYTTQNHLVSPILSTYASPYYAQFRNHLAIAESVPAGAPQEVKVKAENVATNEEVKTGSM